MNHALETVEIDEEEHELAEPHDILDDMLEDDSILLPGDNDMTTFAQNDKNSIGPNEDSI